MDFDMIRHLNTVSGADSPDFGSGRNCSRPVFLPLRSLLRVQSGTWRDYEVNIIPSYLIYLAADLITL